MSGESKQFVQRLYDSFLDGDIDSVLHAMADDFEWNAPGGAPYNGIRHGRDQMREFFHELRRWVRVDQMDVDDVIADGEKVVVVGRQRATVIDTGRHFETPWVHVYTLRGGRLATGLALADTHAIASCFGESTKEREALTGSLGSPREVFSGGGPGE